MVNFFEFSLNAVRLWPVLFALGVFNGFGAAREKGASVSGIGPKDDPTRQTDENWVDDRWQKSEIGPFLSAAVELPGSTVVKGIAIKVGEKNEGAVCFDTELLRYAGGWTGGFLQLNPRRYGLIVTPKPDGIVQFTSGREPGWAHKGSFSDPRKGQLGNLPREWGRYKGLYLNGSRVVLKYAVGQSEILDSPSLERGQELVIFTRTIELSGQTAPLEMRVCDARGARVREIDGIVMVVSDESPNLTAVALTGNGSLTNGVGGCAEIHFKAKTERTLSKALIWRGPSSALAVFAALVKSSAAPTSLRLLTSGGESRWNEPLVTRGTLGIGSGALVIDTLTVPYQNPWKALMFTSGHDFFENGDAAVATVHGDVWKVSGIDDKLQKLTWKRFATGLHQPLGLRIVRDRPYVLGRDQITILRDLNGDGEADYYENFNNDCLSAGGGHSYSTCLETDPAGNFYFLKCAENTPHGGTMLRVSADGQKLDVIATGFRNPNGMGISPSGLITAADQQGEWVPETRVDVIRPEGFYGYMPMHKRSKSPEAFDAPLCWIARTVDNSAGGQVWVPEGTWGPLAGEMIHLSYGRCAMMLLLRDSSQNLIQGGIAPLPGRFLSGAMRGRFNPHDRQLYITGLRGWQTAAVRDGCFQRVRHTGQPLYVPIGYSVEKNGIRLTFPEPLDRSAAENVDSYAIERWNYHWTSTYGSPDFSVSAPEKQGRDPVRLTSAQLSSDNRTLFLQISDLRPAMQMKVQYNLKAADGKGIRNDFFATINALPR